VWRALCHGHRFKRCVPVVANGSTISKINCPVSQLKGGCSQHETPRLGKWHRPGPRSESSLVRLLVPRLIRVEVMHSYPHWMARKIGTGQIVLLLQFRRRHLLSSLRTVDSAGICCNGQANSPSNRKRLVEAVRHCNRGWIGFATAAVGIPGASPLFAGRAGRRNFAGLTNGLTFRSGNTPFRSCYAPAASHPRSPDCSTSFP
jgi:hypothetical protein